MKLTKPLVTSGMVITIAIFFALELLCGGYESTPTLVRLGALVPSRILEGEWWRLVSPAFLHGDWIHVAMNTYVLIALGVFLEKLLGSARFLILYVAATIAGSIGSAIFLSAPLSIGASGAIWGLLGAHAVLAYHPRGILPPAMLPGAKKAALINLGLNIAVSFRPNVDMWAHFSGGAAGALLMLSGVLTHGVAPWGLPRAPTPTWARIGMFAALAIVVSALAAALVEGKPLALIQAPTLTSTPVPELGISLDLPNGLKRQPHADDISFGNIRNDPMVVKLYADAVPPMDPASREHEIDIIKSSLETPKTSTLVQEPASFGSGNKLGLTAQYSYPNGFIFERAFLLLPEKIVHIDLLRWTALDKAAPPGIAKRLIETVTIQNAPPSQTPPR